MYLENTFCFCFAMRAGKWRYRLKYSLILNSVIRENILLMNSWGWCQQARSNLRFLAYSPDTWTSLFISVRNWEGKPYSKLVRSTALGKTITKTNNKKKKTLFLSSWWTDWRSSWLERSAQFGPNSAVLFSNLTSKPRVPQTLRLRRCQGRPRWEAPLRPGPVCAGPPSSAGDRGAAASQSPAPTPSPRAPALQRGPEEPRRTAVPAGWCSWTPWWRSEGSPTTDKARSSAVESRPGHHRKPCGGWRLWDPPSGSPNSGAVNPAGTPAATRPSAQNFRNFEPLRALVPPLARALPLRHPHTR